jgi:TPR repeat protein
MLLHGEGVERDYRQALSWLRTAADQGDGGAQADLGHMVERGLGVEADPKQARGWYELAATQNNAFGLVRLGDLFLNGSGVERSYRKAFSRYLQAAEQSGDPEGAGLARLRIAAMYGQGRGVEQDLRKSFEFTLRAAELGCVEAQRLVGAMYRDGTGVERDHKKAMRWLQKSLRQEGTAADRAMGDLYRDGRFVEKDEAEALRWYKKAADKGDAYAKQEGLKLQQRGLSPAATMADSSPPPPIDARPRPDGSAAPGMKAPAGATRQDDGGTALAAGRLRPLRPAADRRKRQDGKPAKEALAARPDMRGGKTLVRFARVYLAGAMVVAALALAVLVLDWRSGPTGRSALPAAAATAFLRWPGYLPAQPPLPAPPEQALREASSVKVPPPPKAVVRPPAAPAIPVAAAAPPPAPRLRSDYRSLDEAGIRDMLAARGLFDAARNPGGGASQRYQAAAVSGVRLVADLGNGLVWARQPNPVRMNLERTTAWIASLNRIAYGGIRSWRLPTAEEAASLLRSPASAGQGFLDEAFGTGLADAWTGDPQAQAASWSIDFRVGTLRSTRNKARLTALMVSSDPVPAAPGSGREG